MLCCRCAVYSTKCPVYGSVTCSTPKLKLLSAMSTTAIAVFPSPKPPTTVPSSARHLRLRASSSFRNGGARPETGCPVPLEQQPINEYHNLSTSLPFSWAAADAHALQLGGKLAATGLSFALLVGLPVSWFGSGYGSAEPEPIRLLLGSVSSGVVASMVVAVRMYLGWAYVGNRLLSATVEYEETGWYDGQIWVKTPEVLTRDRLLGSFQVKPVLARLKNILNSLAAVLLACGILFLDYEKSESAYRDTSVGEERVVAGVYSEASARSFEPDAFCGNSDPEIGE